MNNLLFLLQAKKKRKKMKQNVRATGIPVEVIRCSHSAGVDRCGGWWQGIKERECRSEFA